MITNSPFTQPTEIFPVNGKVELFPQKGGWHFVRVPYTYTEMTRDLSERGLVAITVTLGSSTWETSLLPKGDGTHFIALSAKIRKNEGVNLGDLVEMSFVLRER